MRNSHTGKALYRHSIQHIEKKELTVTFMKLSKITSKGTHTLEHERKNVTWSGSVLVQGGSKSQNLIPARANALYQPGLIE
jgi:hypothetical protein